jgi:phosphoglucosamine mutase
MLESALESGFNSAGVDVVLLGPLPTPGVAYLTRAVRASLGVVISASHNAFADNGIKFFSAQGSKLPDAWEISVEEALQEPPVWAESAQLGKSRRLDDAAGRYIEFCKSSFASDLTLKGLKIVVDAAHGAAYHIAPKVFHELGAEVITVCNEPDGLNINEGCGALHPEAAGALVRKHNADIGISFDGDADRVIFTDATGQVVSGDRILGLCAIGLKEDDEDMMEENHNADYIDPLNLDAYWLQRQMKEKCGVDDVDDVAQLAVAILRFDCNQERCA